MTTNSGCIEEITALRDNVLRIRVGRGGALAEDASWAVIEESRHSAGTVQREDSSDAVGFRTTRLQVSVRRADLRMSVRDAAGALIQEDAAPVAFEGPSFRLRKTMPVDEHYFGLGDKTGPLDRRNHSFTLWNTDAYRFQESTDPIYKSIPFFMTFRAGVAAGVLLDNTWRSSFDFGKESPTSYSFGAVDGPIDYYVFLGPTPQEVVTTYAWLTGKPPLPPRWMLGFQQSRCTYMPQSRLLEVAERLRADHIPADALYLDIGFQDRNRPFTVDEQAFPDLKGALTKLQAMNSTRWPSRTCTLPNRRSSGTRPMIRAWQRMSFCTPVRRISLRRLRMARPERISGVHPAGSEKVVGVSLQATCGDGLRWFLE